MVVDLPFHEPISIILEVCINAGVTLEGRVGVEKLLKMVINQKFRQKLVKLGKN